MRVPSGGLFLSLIVSFTQAQRIWCIWVIPFNAVLMVCSSKNSLQLYIGTMISPPYVPTSCATFGDPDWCTAFTMSSKHPITILRYFRFKHQLGENFVCPTGKNDILISSCRPPHAIVHQVPVFVLTSTVVSMEIRRCFSKGVRREKMV